MILRVRRKFFEFIMFPNMFMIIALDIIIIMRSSINCSTIICLPTVCILSRQKPLVKTMAARSIFYHIIFRSIKPKTQKYFAAIYLPLLCFALLLIFYTYLYQISSLQVTVKGLTTPYRVGCEDLFVCVGGRDSCVVSYWIDTLVLKN